jgi:hypothetical protein
MAEILVGLMGAAIGAGAAIAGQFLVRRREERERWVGLLLDDCARIYMLEDSYTGALWEAFGGPSEPERLADWPRAERAMAEARLTIVCTDDGLIDSVTTLRDNGRAMWHAAQSGAQPQWDELLQTHRRHLHQFVARARVAARRGHTI